MREGMPLTPTFNAMESVLASVVRRGADCARPAGMAGSAPPLGWRWPGLTHSGLGRWRWAASWFCRGTTPASAVPFPSTGGRETT